MNHIRLPFHQLSRTRVSKLLVLQDKVWPKPEKIAKPIEDRINAYFDKTPSGYEILLIEEGEELLAHAEIFPRMIRTVNGDMEVMALASVCTPPDRRGAGHGRSVVEAAFREVDKGRFKLSLFQTRVPQFYEKLGAHEIFNDFVNSRGKEGVDRDPWWNPNHMIYPGNYIDWPDGEIDLLGPGY